MSENYQLGASLKQQVSICQYRKAHLTLFLCENWIQSGDSKGHCIKCRLIQMMAGISVRC